MTNNNIWGGPLTLAELDTLIDDSVDNKLSSFDLSSFPDPADYEQYLIINSNLAPLVPIDINAFGDNSTIVNRKSITESASAKSGSTKPSKGSRKVTTEEENVANRFKKLAGII